MNPIKPETTLANLPITLEDVFEKKIFEVNALREPKWLRDGKRFSYLDAAPDSEVVTLWIYDMETGARTPLIKPENLRLPSSARSESRARTVAFNEAGELETSTLVIKNYQWSPDESEILFAQAQQHRSFGQGDKQVYIYNLAESRLRLVSNDDRPHLNTKFSPNGELVGYVKGDNLYIADKDGKKELQLTNTAEPAVYNGRFGWVYEEELSLTDGWAWSPDGKRIAYFQVDERAVPVVPLGNYDDLHVKPVQTRYPKAGDPNPVVRIGVIEIPDSLDAKPPVTKWADIGSDPDVYIARMQWTQQGYLVLQRIPRLQNAIELLRVDVRSFKTKVILKEADAAWVDSPGDLKFVENTDQFLWTSDRSGYNHVYLYDLSGNLIRQISSGKWDVQSINAVDAAHRMVYFTAANPNPLERHVFGALLDGGGEIVRLSEPHGVHEPLFSPDGAHFLNRHSSLDTRPTWRLHRSSGHHVALVHANTLPKLENREPGRWELTTLQISDGTVLNAALLKPKNFDPAKKYPVLMYTYGGPGSQVVQDRAAGGWDDVMAEKGYIMARVDGRGSGGRGRDFMKITYQELGRWEVNDQIESAKQLAAMPFVDAARIGIWGWSYGGYMAALCILRGADVFKTAISVAPVTHWQFYDSIYTERYMRRPVDNPKGYEASAPINMADKLKGRYLLVHGTADDNVHFQNSARLAQEFQKSGKQFRTMFYPGKHHGLEGVSHHLYAMMTDFIVENL